VCRSYKTSRQTTKLAQVSLDVLEHLTQHCRPTYTYFYVIAYKMFACNDVHCTACVILIPVRTRGLPAACLKAGHIQH
jgi:hypothetical protein